MVWLVVAAVLGVVWVVSMDVARWRRRRALGAVGHDDHAARPHQLVPMPCRCHTDYAD